MNLMYAGKIKRPLGVSDEDPVPIPLNNALNLHMQVRWSTGGRYDNLVAAKKWVTIKDALADLDASAIIQLVSGTPGDPFTVVARNLLDCVIPTASMATLTVGTIYYLDVQILEASQPYTILYDRIRPFQQVTRAVS